MRKPLCIDLFCGLFGWSEGFIQEGYEVIGFDIVDMRKQLGFGRLPNSHLVIQDVLSIHGSQFKDADCIVCSPPCQRYSFMAMPWRIGKARAAAIRADATGKELERLNRLFMSCFRIQREACEAAGRHIPMVVENVRGAIPWVGRSRWNFGSFHLWGDIPALMPATLRAAKAPGCGANIPGVGWSGFANEGWRDHHATKIAGFRFDGSGRSFQSASVNECGVKDKDADGYNRTHPAAFGWKSPRTTSSNVSARKAASAMIAKIPPALSRWIARCFLPRAEEAA